MKKPITGEIARMSGIEVRRPARLSVEYFSSSELDLFVMSVLDLAQVWYPEQALPPPARAY